MSSEAIVGAIVGIMGLVAGWILHARTAGRREGRAEGNLETLDAKLDAVAEKLELLGDDSRLAWGALGKDVGELRAEMRELRKDLLARDRRLWERWESHDRKLVRLEEWRRAQENGT